VALVDAFGFEDYALNSALGRYDGDVYRALLDMAQASAVAGRCMHQQQPAHSCPPVVQPGWLAACLHVRLSSRGLLPAGGNGCQRWLVLAGRRRPR
jgi:hypothetical protein